MYCVRLLSGCVNNHQTAEVLDPLCYSTRNVSETTHTRKINIPQYKCPNSLINKSSIIITKRVWLSVDAISWKPRIQARLALHTKRHRGVCTCSWRAVLGTEPCCRAVRCADITEAYGILSVECSAGNPLDSHPRNKTPRFQEKPRTEPHITFNSKLNIIQAMRC